MEEKAIKAAAVTLLVLSIAACWFMPRMSDLHTWAVEWEEDRLAAAELAEEQNEMNDLAMKDTEVESENMHRQLRLMLPEGVSGSKVKVQNDYVTQTVRIEIPGTDARYFDSYPIVGSSNHIAGLSYQQTEEEGVIEIVTDRVYELDMEYDENYYYFDFLTPQEVYDKVVVVDAGHGGRAPGATKQGVNEKDIDLAILLQLKEIFDNSEENIGVYYTRTDDSNPTFDQRVQLANKSDADLFISIHNNSTRSGRMSSTNGTQVMYSESDEGTLTSERFAQICLDEVTAGIGSRDKGLVAGDAIYIIRTSEVPVALIEVGFMTNQRELDLLRTEEYQKQTAEAIYSAIHTAFEEGY